MKLWWTIALSENSDEQVLVQIINFFTKSEHPSIICNQLSLSGSRGGSSLYQLAFGERYGTPWTSCQLLYYITDYYQNKMCQYPLFWQKIWGCSVKTFLINKETCDQPIPIQVPPTSNLSPTHSEYTYRSDNVYLLIPNDMVMVILWIPLEGSCIVGWLAGWLIKYYIFWQTLTANSHQKQRMVCASNCSINTQKQLSCQQQLLRSGKDGDRSNCYHQAE